MVADFKETYLGGSAHDALPWLDDTRGRDTIWGKEHIDFVLLWTEGSSSRVPSKSGFQALKFASILANSCAPINELLDKCEVILNLEERIVAEGVSTTFDYVAGGKKFMRSGKEHIRIRTVRLMFLIHLAMKVLEKIEERLANEDLSSDEGYVNVAIDADEEDEESG
jgi:hypothetical protein